MIPSSRRRVTLVHTDDDRGEARYVIDRGETRPRQGILVLEFLDSVGQRALVVVEVEKDPIVLDRRRVLLRIADMKPLFGSNPT